MSPSPKATGGKHRFYYSVQSLLAHNFAVLYYNNTHYIYAAKQFDMQSQSSSNPKWIYETYKSIHDGIDFGNHKFKAHLKALRRVAGLKYAGGLLDTYYTDILYLTNPLIAMHYMSPVLYIIDAEAVQKRIQPVPIKLRASPFGEEFIIPDLHPDEFECLYGV
jgi:hypothetical protein